MTELKSFDVYTEPHFVVNPSYLEVLKALKGVKSIGFDIETTFHGARAPGSFIRLYQMYSPVTDTAYLWDTKSLEAPFGSDSLQSSSLLLEALLNPKIQKCIHNGLFEHSWIFEKHDIMIQNIYDTMVCSQVNKAGLYMAYLAKGIEEPNSLATLSKEYSLGLKKEYQDYRYDNLDIDISTEVYAYAANDSKATWYLAQIMERPVQDIDLQAVESFGRLNATGLPVKYQELIRVRDAYLEKEAELKAQIIELTGGVNPGSPKQVKAWLQKVYGEVPQSFDRKEKKMKESTNKSSLGQFLSKLQIQKQDISILKLILDWRTIKTCSNYPKDYLKKTQKIGNTYRTYGNYKVLGFQGEGRSSCSESNIQNVPKHTSVLERHKLPKLRGMFQPDPGKVFIEIDLAAAHAQIARYFSKDEKLKKSRDTGLKLHFFTLQTMLKQQGIEISVQEIKKAKKDKAHKYYELINRLYKLSKNVFYSFLNFSGAKTLQDTFAKEEEILTQAVCQTYLDATAETFSGLRDFQQKLIAKVASRQQPFLTPNRVYLGSVGYLKIPDKSIIYFPKTTSTASKICAAVWLRTEATAMKQSILKINQLFDSQYFGQAEIVNFSHDSVLLHVDEEVALEVAPACYDIINYHITQYVEDYALEEESVATCEINPELDVPYANQSYLGYELKYAWN